MVMKKCDGTVYVTFKVQVLRVNLAGRSTINAALFTTEVILDGQRE